MARAFFFWYASWGLRWGVEHNWITLITRGEQNKTIFQAPENMSFKMTWLVMHYANIF